MLFSNILFKRVDFPEFEGPATNMENGCCNITLLSESAVAGGGGWWWWWAPLAINDWDLKSYYSRQQHC
jgi:hypothetical protein